MNSGDVQARIRTLIVIDVRLYREGLATTLGARERLHVAGAVGSRSDALRAVGEVSPDLVIVDVALPEALDLMRDLRAQRPTTRIIAFAVDEDISAVLDCAEAGAAGFVTANASIDELVDAIERTIAGELLCSPRIAAELLRRAADPRGGNGTAPDGLTNREREVLAFVRQGRSNKEIGAALNIAEATVKNHVHHILEKLQVANRGQAAIQGATGTSLLRPGRSRLAAG